MEFLLIVVILLALAAFVAVPLRRPAPEVERGDDPALADLEARKEAKYREIRDAQVDHATGKLSDEEWRRQDAELRRDAIAILKQIDEVEAGRHGDG